MIEKLSGLKTYAAYVLLIAWAVVYAKVAGVKEAVGFENFGVVFVAILGMAGISQRAATAKTQGRVEDLHEVVTPPKAGGA